jgi:amino acid adenylation domain-containing protein
VLGVERVGVDDDFFSLGGHSLLAIRVLTRISEAFGTDLPLSDLFAAPTVAELARRLDGPGAQAVAPEPAAGEPPRLSLAQQRLWLLDVLEPGSAKYNVPVAVRLRGTLEVDILVRTLAEIVRRHEPLRTVYAQAEGEPVQVVLPPPGEDGLDFSRLDLRDLSPGLRERAWPEALRDAAARPFDLARGPVVVFFLLELGAEDRVLLALFHHIATDGWSMSVFFRELAVLYGDLAAGRGPSLPEPPLRYVSWANWQRRALEEGSLDAQLSYWRSELAGVPVLELAADRPRSAAAGDRGASRAVAFPDEAIGRLRGLALDRGITPFNLLLAGFATLLSRLSGQRDFAVGLTAAGRKRLHVEELIGFFVNTLAARIRVEDDPAFGSLVARIRDTVLAAQTHQDVPFERVVEDLQPERTVGTSPLFQVAFTYLASPLAPISMPGLTLTLVDVEATTSKFDLTLSVYEEERGLRGWVEYRSGLFDPATIERWMGNLRTLLEGAAVDPSRPLSALPLLSAGERQQLLREWAGEAPEPAGAAGRGIEEWIAAQARRTPEAVAVVQGERELTYGQLVAGAARLTQVLRVRGVGPEVAVGIHLRKSPEAALAILAVLRAGGAYLPLDPAYPEERLAWLRADARVPLVVDEALLTAAASAFPAAAGREDGAPPACPAYLLYTSGSTGRPKGVVVTRAALLASTRARLEGYTGRVSAFLLLPSLAFDSSVAGLFWTLCQGGTLVLPEEGEERDPARLARLIERRRVSHWLSIPFLYDLVIDAAEPGQLRSLTAVIVAGEPAPADLPRRHAALLPGVPLLNEYGPTEGTVWAAAGELAAGERITIGRPIAGARVLLLDRTMRPVPAGVPAELFLGCEGLARGYFGRPDLTAERFVPAPDGAPGARLYRTGDLARWLPDGRLDLLGRADEQAKIRGFRIEPAEIEAALERCPAVRQAVVVVRDLAAGDRRLVGFVVAAEDLDLGALRQQLADRLPPHMVPAELAVLEALPLLPNGKVDRGALRGLAATRVGSQETAPPAGDLERRLAAIWEELLEVPAVGRDDSFFALGGHSLNAIRLVSRVRTALGVELPVSAVFEAPTLAAMARRLARALGKLETPAAPPIVALPRSSEGEPLSFSQQRLWFLHQLEPGATYHVPGALRVRGALREDVLERTLAEIVRRHEALRTVFRNVASAPVQIVLPPAGLRLPVADLTSLPAEEREAEAGRLLAREARRSFDLETGPLVRALLIRLADDERLLTVVTHHIASDAWSLGVLLRELGEIYSAFVAGKPSQLPALPVQYPDFARWQRSWLSGQVLERELAHWRRVLAGAPESLGLPYDRLPSAAAKARGGRRTFALSADLWQRLLELARREGWTPFMALLAGFQALFSRYGDQEDVVVGSPIANRNWLEFEGLIGFFTNTLALRLDLAGDPSFRELGRRVRAVALETYAHQDLPFEKVVEELAPDRHPSRNPLFQTVLVLEKPPVPPALPGVTCELSDVDTGTAKFDLTLMLTEGEDGAAGWMEYARDLFDGATVDRILGHLRTLLAAAVADPERRLADLPLLTDEESAQLLVKWKQDRADWPTDMLLHELFEAQARRTPEATAVIGPEERLSYGELAARVDRTARRLRALGVGPEIPVGVFLRRTERLVVSLLGILKAGGAYVPLDPAYPAERIDAILGDVRAPLVITEEALLDALPAHLNAGIVRADEEGPADLPVLEPPAVREGRLAYVIYTSGSMGRPKGVAIEHRSAAALMHWSRDSFTPQELAGVLASTSISFDMSVFELFATLSWGGTVILADNALALAELPARGEVTLIDTVPAAMTELLRQGAVPASVRTVNLGGEPLRGALARQIHGLGTVKRLLNLYGPSEDTTFSTVAEVGAEGEPAIGRVLPNAWGYVLDNRLRPVPVGVAGELYLGGVGLSRGYLGRPELTAERYVPDPFSASPGERLYKTGDLVRYRPDGELDYLGRLDHQVKVRGFRVELGEIEVALQGHPALRDAAVLAVGEGGERRLVAYLVARPGEPAPSFTELRSYLKEKLPAYMLPSATVVLEALPLTPNGKLDRRALARIEAERTLEEEGHAAPLTPLESGLAEIWNEVLGRPPAAAGEDFFQLGGHSLLAAQVASRIRETFGVDLPLRRLFEASTLAAMARAVLDAGDRGSPSPPIGPVPRNGDLPLSFSQERLWFLHRLQPESSAYNIPLALRVEGHLDPHRLAAALSAVARRHEVLRTVFAERDGGPIQIVLSPSDIALPAVDLRGLPLAAREEEARRLTAEEAMRPFDLARGPLLRCVLLELALEQAVLVLNLHHIVTDGWSMGVLVRELNALYAGSSLPELPVQYADFAAWQRRWLAGETLDRQMAWWRERLHGAPSALELPADHARPPVLSQRGAEHRFALSGELSRSIAELARRESVTPFMVLAAGLFALLSRLTGQRDLTIGSPMAGRNHLETEGLIGFFVNTLVLRAHLDRTASFRDLLRQVREASLGAYAHQDLPFEKLVDELHPKRDLSRSPLFQVALALQNAPLPAADLGGVRLAPEEIFAGVAKFDLSFIFMEAADGHLTGLLEYATDLFDPATAARYSRHLTVLLGELVARPRGRWSETPLLAAAERQQLLREWNDTRTEVAREVTIHRRFEERADLQPQALAAVWEGERLTYGGLEAKANRLAWLLRDLGAGPGTPVGVWLERSLDMVVAVLGILKAGGHYLPLDVSWPTERAEAILAASRAPIVVTRSGLLPRVLEAQWRLPLADVVCLDVDAPRPPAEPVDAGEVSTLWDFVAERAVDQVSAGGFVSSYTGLPFSEAEVDEYRDRVLSLAAPWLRPDARVLEIGCGSGLVLWELAPRVAWAVGLDPSGLTQERNRAYAAERGFTHVELRTGFAHEIDDLPAAAFDLVVLASTVQFFPGPLYLERIVEKALRRLVPGGALLIADVPDARRRREFQESLSAAPHAATGPIEWFDEDLFRDLSAALPEAAEASILHRREGFANELRFRYDVLLTRGDGERAAEPRRKRLWTGWHVERCSAERPPAAASPDDVAYVIHTSGSTGEPKGIGVQHRPAVGLIDWVNGTFGVGPGDRLLFTTSLGFDLSVYDIFGTLAAGGTIHVAPEAALRDPVLLAAMLRDEPVTLWDSAPAALQQLAPLFPTDGGAGRRWRPLRLVLLSGDWIPVPLPDQVRTAFPGARVVSLGGATEATVWSNWYPIGEVDPRWTSIPYGRPIADARYYVLDAALSPCPVGVPGDLYIGGDVLCMGYVYQPDLTAAQFLPDPFAAASRRGARMYHTGDRARYGADGNLEFLGRVDYQVKIRGYRIELGEIEVALSRHPGVREAIVLAREDVPGDKRLVGYIVPARQPAPTAAELREFLLASLPEYMVPWAFVELQAFPVTTNGKLDRAALPAPQASPSAVGGAYVAPRNELERSIARVWREVLGVERVGVNDNFFESGGSSLLIVKLHTRLKEALGRDVPVMELFRHTTIDALARKLAEENETPPAVEETAGRRARTRQESLRHLQEVRAGRRGGRV